MTTSIKGKSRNIVVSSQGALCVGRDRLLETVKTAMTQSASVTKPVIRTVHPNPRRRNRCWYMMGHVTPPVKGLAIAKMLLRAALTDARSCDRDSEGSTPVLVEMR